MLARQVIQRPVKKIKLSKAISSVSGKMQYVRANINSDGQVTPLSDQESITTLSFTDCLVLVNERDEKLNSGDLVNVMMINQE
jgi:molybdopterin biosynthesis enzyme